MQARRACACDKDAGAVRSPSRCELPCAQRWPTPAPPVPARPARSSALARRRRAIARQRRAQPLERPQPSPRRRRAGADAVAGPTEPDAGASTEPAEPVDRRPPPPRRRPSRRRRRRPRQPAPGATAAGRAGRRRPRRRRRHAPSKAARPTKAHRPTTRPTPKPPTPLPTTRSDGRRPSADGRRAERAAQSVEDVHGLRCRRPARSCVLHLGGHLRRRGQHLHGGGAVGDVAEVHVVDVDAGLGEGRGDRGDHPRAVVVADDEQVAGRRQVDGEVVEHRDAGLALRARRACRRWRGRRRAR